MSKLTSSPKTPNLLKFQNFSLVCTIIRWRSGTTSRRCLVEGSIDLCCRYFIRWQSLISYDDIIYDDEGTTMISSSLSRGGTDLEIGYGDVRSWRSPFHASPVVLPLTRVPFQAKESVHKTPFWENLEILASIASIFTQNLAHKPPKSEIFCSQAPLFRGKCQFASPTLWKSGSHTPTWKKIWVPPRALSPRHHISYHIKLYSNIIHRSTNWWKLIFSMYFSKHVKTHNYPTRNAHDDSNNKTKKMFSDCAIRNCGPSFWNSLDKTVKHCKTTKHFWNQFYYLNTGTIDFILGHVLCILVYFVCLCMFNVTTENWELQAQQRDSWRSTITSSALSYEAKRILQAESKRQERKSRIANANTTSTTTANSSSGVTCLVCHRSFRAKIGLISHMRTHNSTTS